MKKHFKILTGLIIFLLIALSSCKNSFLSKQNVEGGSISILLPGSGRAADSDQIFTFEISFKNTQTQSEKILTGKTGDKIVYSNARPGEYQIMAQVFNESGRLCYEAKATAIVKAGATTPVTLELLRFLRLWTINDDYSNYIKRYFDEHQDDGIFLEITKYDNAEEYYAQLDKALKTNALDAPDIFSVEDPALLRYTQGDMQDYTLPFDSLGITQTQIDAAQFYDYILQMATGTDNKIHGLGYQSTAGAMIYNKAIAEELDRADAFAGSNATTTEEKLYQTIFPGIEPDPYASFENLCYLGDDLENINKYLVSTYDDIWKMYRAVYEETEDDDGNPYNRYCRWIDEDNNLVLNPTPDYFYNHFVSPTNYESMIPCHNTDPWSDEWFTDMTNDKVFAFFAPAWFINYCLKDSAKVSNDKWGIMQAPVPFTWGGSFLMVNKNLPDLKKGVTQRIIEWMMLDTSTDGLMYKVASEEKDTVTSQVVMNKIIEEGKGTSATLGGADIFTIYDAAAQSVNAEYKTPYDSTLDDMFMQEIRDHKNFGLPREGTLMRFELNVFRRFGFRGDDLEDGPIELKSEDGDLDNSHLSYFKAEPCDEGIKFTLTFTSQGGSIQFDENFTNTFNTYFIRNSQDGIAMFLNELLSANKEEFLQKEPGDSLTITCIYPVNLNKDEYYCFDLNYHALDSSTGEDQYIPFLIKAGGGKEYIKYDNYEQAKPKMVNFVQPEESPESYNIYFDIIPSSKLLSYLTFDKDVDSTNISPDYDVIVQYIDEENINRELVLYGKEYNETQKLYSEGYSNGFEASFTAMSVQETNPDTPNPFFVRQFINFYINGDTFQNLRFRIPPVSSDEYKILNNGDNSYTILSPDGTELISFIPQY